MNLLEDIPEYKKPSRSSLTHQATNLVGRRKTRRGKKRKSPQALKWQLDKEKALKLYQQQKKERAQEYKNFHRLIEKE